MATFYLGLSMAGTVSAGTYTGGTLVELNRWLYSWQQAKKTGITLKAIKDTANYKAGDDVVIPASEIPQHDVKIKSMSGASGGFVNAALYLSALTTGKVEELIRETWTYFDVRDMLDTSDLTKSKSIYSVLNVKPIDEMTKKLLNEKWTSQDFAAELDYLDDNIELFAMVASYEGIPFKTAAASGSGVSYGIHKTHMDYVKFNFQKYAGKPSTNTVPYAYNLLFRPGQFFKDDDSWAKFVESAPASGAFPIGFKPRALKRFRKEYDGKLFYMDYTMPSEKIKYASLSPAWPPGNPDDVFDMEYVDGGTFNREPHDLARASIIQSLNFAKPEIPNDGIKTNACVILVDPFPSNFDSQKKPGEKVTGIPTLFEQPLYLVGAMMDQGRFRPDWIEKALDENYYSRYLISPVRKDDSGNMAELPLAAGLLGAFSGFIDQSYREHDYRLGHYNTFQFLRTYFAVPEKNEVVDYYTKATDEVKEKYDAVGWYLPKKKGEKYNHCLIIPRTMEAENISSVQPVWPTLSYDKWEEIRSLAMERAKELCDAATDFNLILENTADPFIWKFFIKGRVEKMIDGIEKELIDNGLLRK